MLQEKTDGASVLELFAGVGTLGLEALSRGAAFATFVELRKDIAELIRATLQRLEWTERTRILRANAYTAIGLLEDQGDRYSLIFLDPPYSDARAVEPGTPIHDLVDRLGRSFVVTEGADLFLQHPRQVDLDLQLSAIEVCETRPYGSTAITVMRKRRTVDDVEECEGNG